MLFNRSNYSWLASGLLLLLVLATPSFGQGPQGFQLFAPADVSTYGGGLEPNEGYFFQFDGLYWSINAPKIRDIGYPGTRTVYYGPTDDDAAVQSNTLDTSFIQQKFSAGSRFEFGRVEDRNGWFVSILQLRDQTQNTSVASADVVFNDPEIGPLGHPLLYGNVNNDGGTIPPYTPAVFRNLPVTFYNVNMVNAVDTWGVEVNYLHQFMTGHHGGSFELFLGTRYYEFNDNFYVTTGSDDGSHTVPSYLGGSSWSTQAQNHIVGPQIGLRWSKKQGRWSFSTEGRFMAGLNCQNIQQQVNMGPNLDPGPTTYISVNPTPPPATISSYAYTPFQPLSMGPTTATHTEYVREFSPAVELRIEGRYQITRAITFHAGWTGIWMDGIARANGLVDYTVPAMGVDMANNRQNLFMNGLTLGFDINR